MAPGITFIGHATVLIEIDGVRILTDPILLPRVLFLDRVVSPIRESSYRDIDIVLISHLHHDHCDIRSLRRLSGATIVVPQGSAGYLRRRGGLHKLVEVGQGTTLELGGVLVTAVHADHDGKRVPLGPNAAALGFVITGSEGTVYFAGDTDVYPEMASLPMPESAGIDTALLPVWGWGPNLGPGHMNPQRAADALALLQARNAMPIHWGTLFPYGMRRVLPSSSTLLFAPPEQFAELAARSAPDSQVAVVKPGGRMGTGDE